LGCYNPRVARTILSVDIPYEAVYLLLKATDSKLSHELLAEALRKQLLKRRPEAGVMFHSDRGTSFFHTLKDGTHLF
jgi:hypothetical protein